MNKVLVLNGPNIGRLGTRQPEVYGGTTYAQLAEHLVGTGKGLGLDVEVRQTEHEGRMIEWLHEAADTGADVVLNAGAWTHYSYAIADAAALSSIRVTLTAESGELMRMNFAAENSGDLHVNADAVFTGAAFALTVHAVFRNIFALISEIHQS